MSDRVDEPRPSERWLSDKEQELWQSLVRVVISLPVVLDRELEGRLGITNFEYGLLARLSRVPERRERLGSMAQETGSTLPRLSKAVTRCVREGWIVRQQDPKDGRATLAVLTQSGLDKLDACAPTHVAQVRRLIFDPLSVAAQQQFGSAVTRILESMQVEQERQARRVTT